MVNKIALLLPRLLLTLVLISSASLISPSRAFAVESEQEKQNSAQKAQQEVAEKHYRQALYFYFQGKSEQALQQLHLSELRLEKVSSKAKLFGAGLQLSLGLQQQATNTLLNFENNKVLTKQDELLVIALLQLAEQYLQQEKQTKAQAVLQKITRVSQTNYSQYHLLNQLAYWPELPRLLPVSANIIIEADNGFSNDNSAGNVEEYSPSVYVQLNLALLYIEHKEFTLAEQTLATLKNRAWQPVEKGFWQQLFSFDYDVSFFSDAGTTAALSQQESQQQIEKQQHQAVNDYAQLLLAQLYVAQGQYQQAYVELKAFPQQSPYAQTAMFLFAFSAQQSKQYTTSYNVLKYLYQAKPYSNIAWQSGSLLAMQIKEQGTLAQALKLHEDVEIFYLQRLAELNEYEKNNAQRVTSQQNSRSISSSSNLKNSSSNNVTDIYWHNKAMINIKLQSLHQDDKALLHATTQLSVMREKVANINEILKLNNLRKQRVATAQQQYNYQQQIVDLSERRDTLAAQLRQAEQQQNGSFFADSSEQLWLQRISKSERYLTSLIGNKNVDSYQARLARVNSVLQWRLSQQYPQRLWTHKQALKQVEQATTQLNHQYNKVTEITQSQESLQALSTRYRAGKNKTALLAQKIRRLQQKTQQKIQQSMKVFVQEQRQLLNQYLLGTRQQMANVLEQMAIKDKKIELQLNPEQLNSSDAS